MTSERDMLLIVDEVQTGFSLHGIVLRLPVLWRSSPIS